MALAVSISPFSYGKPFWSYITCCFLLSRIYSFLPSSPHSLSQHRHSPFQTLPTPTSNSPISFLPFHHTPISVVCLTTPNHCHLPCLLVPKPKNALATNKTDSTTPTSSEYRSTLTQLSWKLFLPTRIEDVSRQFVPSEHRISSLPMVSLCLAPLLLPTGIDIGGL